jgi:hypothetical protein
VLRPGEQVSSRFRRATSRSLPARPSRAERRGGSSASTTTCGKHARRDSRNRKRSVVDYPAELGRLSATPGWVGEPFYICVKPPATNAGPVKRSRPRSTGTVIAQSGTWRDMASPPERPSPSGIESPWPLRLDGERERRSVGVDLEPLRLRVHQAIRLLLWLHSLLTSRTGTSPRSTSTRRSPTGCSGTWRGRAPCWTSMGSRGRSSSRKSRRGSAVRRLLVEQGHEVQAHRLPAALPDGRAALRGSGARKRRWRMPPVRP